MSTKIICYQIERADCSSCSVGGSQVGNLCGIPLGGELPQMNDHLLFSAVAPEELYVCINETWIQCVLHLTISQQITTSFSLVFPPSVDILPLCLDSVYWGFWFLFVSSEGFFSFFDLLFLFCAVMTHTEVRLYCGRLCPLAACLCAYLQGRLHTCLRLRLFFYKNG